MIHAMQFTVDAEHRVIAGRQVDVGGLLLEHQIEESVNFSHKIFADERLLANPAPQCKRYSF